MATETIGGVNLSGYGLRLAKLDGQFDLPAFKKVIDEHTFNSELLKVDEKTVKIRLIGIYANKTSLTQNIENFKDKIRSAIKQNWTFSQHSFSELCVVKNGFNCEIHGGTSVEIYITLTITD